MNVKSYIAFFFALVFFGKFLIIDSKIFVAVFEADDIAFVNPFCEKINAKFQGDTYESFSEDLNRLQIAFDSFCNTPLQFEVFNWEQRIIPEESRAYAYHTPPLPESNQERFYPPPKV